MDQQKIGKLLKELRKEKGLTQEQFAEIVSVSNRTVSRWENGSNMPDLDVLIEIADYYDIDLRDLLDGERKDKNMDKELKETVLKAADYTNAETEKYAKRVDLVLKIGVILWLISTIIGRFAHYMWPNETTVFNSISDFAEGAASAMLICGIILTSRFGRKISAFKERLLKRS